MYIYSDIVISKHLNKSWPATDHSYQKAPATSAKPGLDNELSATVSSTTVHTKMSTNMMVWMGSGGFLS